MPGTVTDARKCTNSRKLPASGPAFRPCPVPDTVRSATTSTGLTQVDRQAEADRRALERAGEQELQRERRLLAAVDVPVRALGLPVGAALEDREARARRRSARSPSSSTRAGGGARAGPPRRRAATRPRSAGARPRRRRTRRASSSVRPVSGPPPGPGHLEPRDREPRRRDRVALDLDERRAAAAAAASTPRRTASRRTCPSRGRRNVVVTRAAARRLDEPVRTARPRRATGAGTRTVSRAGNAASPPPATITHSDADERRDPAAPAARPSSSPTRARVRLAAVRERPQRRLAVAPARARRPACRGLARRERRPLARREQVGVPPLHAAHRRAAARGRARSSRPTRRRRVPHEHPDAVQPRAVQLVEVVAVPAARVVEHVPLLEPLRAEHAGHRAVGEPLRPREVVVGDPLERHRRLALERHVRAERGAPAPAAPPSSCRGRRRRRRARARARRAPPRRRPARGACRRPTGCSRRRRGCRARWKVGDQLGQLRARRGTSRTGCARRCRSPGRRARARCRPAAERLGVGEQALGREALLRRGRRAARPRARRARRRSSAASRRARAARTRCRRSRSAPRPRRASA